MYIISSCNFLLAIPLRFQRVSKRLSNSSYLPEILLLCIVKSCIYDSLKNIYLDTMPCDSKHIKAKDARKNRQGGAPTGRAQKESGG